MTRTRTQTTLNKLVVMVANVHGELAFVEGLMDGPARQQTGGGSRPRASGAGPVGEAGAALRREVLARRRAELLEARDALHATVRQFDPELRPEDIGVLGDWLKPFGRKWTKATVGRYLAAMRT
jgi:hypothetical protein